MMSQHPHALATPTAPDAITTAGIVSGALKTFSAMTEAFSSAATTTAAAVLAIDCVPEPSAAGGGDVFAFFFFFKKPVIELYQHRVSEAVF